MNALADWDSRLERVCANHLLCHMSESNHSELELHKLSLHAEAAYARAHTHTSERACAPMVFLSRSRAHL